MEFKTFMFVNFILDLYKIISAYQILNPSKDFKTTSNAFMMWLSLVWKSGTSLSILLDLYKLNIYEKISNFKI